MSARKIIEETDSAVKVRFSPDVLAATGFKGLAADNDGMAESMWVQPLRELGGDLKLGSLRNDAVCFLLEWGDYVVYYDGPWRIAVAAYSARKYTAAYAVYDANARAAEFNKHAGAEVEKTAASLRCAKCKADDAMGEDTGRGVWMVTNAAWSKVPPRFQRKILCKKCFRDVTGLDPEKHRRFNHDGTLRAQ